MTDSLKSKRILGTSFCLVLVRALIFAPIDPEEYRLVDKPGEKKFDIVLEDVLARAREAKIFQGCTFHITPNVKPSREVLKRVIEAHGGVVSPPHFVSSKSKLIDMRSRQFSRITPRDELSRNRKRTSSPARKIDKNGTP